MNKAFAAGLRKLIIVPATLLAIGISTRAAFAQNKLYSPIPLTTAVLNFPIHFQTKIFPQVRVDSPVIIR